MSRFCSASARCGAGLEVLERVLAANLLHRPGLGYTQGMNYLAAFLLLTLQLCGSAAGEDAEDGLLGAGHTTAPAAEEDAFWILDAMLAQVGDRAAPSIFFCVLPVHMWLGVSLGPHLF